MAINSTPTSQLPSPPFPSQLQQPPGEESQMSPPPVAVDTSRKPSNKLAGKVMVITGGDSGIGRAVSLLAAREGADIAIAYLNEHADAEETKRQIESAGKRCFLFAGDVGSKAFCQKIISETIAKLGQIDILVNNAAEQHPQEDIKNITEEQLEKTFRTNIFSQFFLTQAALPHLRQGSSIINTTSVTAYRGSSHLVDYSSTKGAIVAFTRSLSESLAPHGIRVNAVAPGPVWTPLIVSTFPPEKSRNFGKDVPLGRPAQPEEIAPCFIFLASQDASYMTGQVLHPNGGEIING